jgi:hypothetical protein
MNRFGHHVRPCMPVRQRTLKGMKVGERGEA